MTLKTHENACISFYTKEFVASVRQYCTSLHGHVCVCVSVGSFEWVHVRARSFVRVVCVRVCACTCMKDSARGSRMVWSRVLKLAVLQHMSHSNPKLLSQPPFRIICDEKITAKKHLFWPNLIYAYMNRGVHVDLEDSCRCQQIFVAAYKRAATCLHRWIDVFMHVNTYENKSITTRIAQVCWICVFSKTFASSSQNSGKNCCDESISTFRGNSANSAVSFWFVRSFSQVYCRKELTPGP